MRIGKSPMAACSNAGKVDFFFFTSRRRHTRCLSDWSSDVCSSDRLLAIVKARTWIDDLVSGRVQSFAEIAQHEGKVERHVRLLAPLAFTPPGMLAAIIAGAAPSDLTVTALAQTIPNAWERSA